MKNDYKNYEFGLRNKMFSILYMKKPWSNLHVQLYNSLFNYLIKNEIYNNIEIDTYIIKKKRYLMSIIENNKEWSNSTKKSYLFMIARFLVNNEQLKYSKLYSQSAYDLKKIIEEKEGENKLDEKEEQNIKPYNYFTNILNNIDYKQITNLKDHYNYLLLALLIYQPPVRTSFYTSCKIITRRKNNDKVNNFILISKKGKNKCQFIINKDKATNYKLYNIDTSLSHIDIEDSKLIDLIHYSYETYPRIYLFENTLKKQINSKSLLKHLRNITLIDSININMMRSIYITEFYKNNVNYNDKLKLSKKMRHSVNTASINYNKITNTNINFEEENIKKINDLNTEIYELKKINDSLKINCPNVENIENKAFNKRRNDIIYLIKNKNHICKESTRIKYNI